MSSFTEQMTQELSIADYLAPANTVNSATAVNTSGIDMSKFERVMYIITIGGITGAGTVDAKLQSAAASNFGTAHNMTSGAVTQVTNAGVNTVITLETTADAIQNQNNGDRYVRCSVTIGANSVNFGVVGIGGVATQEPGNAQDIANTVGQRLVVT